MNSNIRRIVFSCFVLGVAAAGLAIPTSAHGQFRAQQPAAQQRIAEGTHQWMNDGWCYVVQGGRWVRTGYFRQYPDRRNYPNVYDIYQNGRFLQRVGATAPAAVQLQGQNRQPSEAQLRQVLGELQRQVAISNAQAARGTAPIAAGSGGTIGGYTLGSPVVVTGRVPAGTGGTIGGFSLNTPNHNLLTVDSVRADAIRAQPGAIGQAAGLANEINTQFVNRGTAIRLADGTLVYVR